MREQRPLPSRERLLHAAAELLSTSDGREVSIRAICDHAGVTLPTLYHFFGSKEGLMNQVVAHGFETYLSQKRDHVSTNDPIEAIREGWDGHVQFGRENPSFYAIMYGRVRPGRRPVSADEAEGMLLGLTRRARDQGRLRVGPEQAADIILATNVGVTLALITRPTDEPDPALSQYVRETIIAALTVNDRATPEADQLDAQGDAAMIKVLADSLRHALDVTEVPLAAPEQGMLIYLLQRLGTTTTR